MNTATSVAISTAALIESSNAKVASCEAYVRDYQHKTAAVAEMRVYAGCIDLLHPNPMSSGEIVLAKVSILVVILGMVIGVIVGRKNQYMNGFESVCFGALCGLCISVCVLAALFALWFGVKFLFS